MSTIKSDVEKQVRARLEELEPLIEEYEQLRQVLAVFERSSSEDHDPRPGGSSRSRRTRPRSGARADQALNLVSRRPGITVAEIAEEMGIGSSYLYRLLPALERDGKLRKAGKGYEPAGATDV